MLVLTFALIACEGDQELVTDSGVKDTDTGWEAWVDTQTDTDTGVDSDTGNPPDTADTSDSGETAETGDTAEIGETGDTSDTSDTADTGDTGVEMSECQIALLAAGYPVFVEAGDTFTVTLTGADRPWATLSWASEESDQGYWIACGEIADGSSANLVVEPELDYTASTFGNEDPGTGAEPDSNGFWWFSGDITGGNLGGNSYSVEYDAETDQVHLVAD